jgi:hypothetical protein
MKERIHLLEFRGELPLTDPEIIKGSRVECCEMDVAIDKARHQGIITRVDYLHTGRDGGGVPRSDLTNLVTFYQN